MVRVKICCIADEVEASMAIRAGADALGLVGAMPSGPGVIEDATIARIAASIAPPTRTFLLSSATGAEPLVGHVARTRPTTLQLVDRPDPEAYAALRAAYPELELVQVIHVRSTASLDEAVEAAPRVDALLLDSGRPEGAVKLLGGTGRTHDWSLSRRIVASVNCPVWLAGGLRAENVARAVEQVRPYGLDVCSGVRKQGRLDRRRLQAFFQAIPS